MGYRIKKRLMAHSVSGLFQLLRQIEIVPANDTVLDEPLTQKLAGIEMAREKR